MKGWTSNFRKGFSTYPFEESPCYCRWLFLWWAWSCCPRQFVKVSPLRLLDDGQLPAQQDTGNLSFSLVNSKKLREAVRVVRAGEALVVFQRERFLVFTWSHCAPLIQRGYLMFQWFCGWLDRLSCRCFFEFRKASTSNYLVWFIQNYGPGCWSEYFSTSNDPLLRIFVGKGFHYKRLQKFESNEKLIEHLRFKTYFLLIRQYKQWILLHK